MATATATGIASSIYFEKYTAEPWYSFGSHVNLGHVVFPVRFITIVASWIDVFHDEAAFEYTLSVQTEQINADN